MRTVNVHQAKTHFSRLLEAVAAGEEIIIAKAGKPVARLVPLALNGEPRTPGALAGRIWFGKGFDDPLPLPVAAALRGESP